MYKTCFKGAIKLLFVFSLINLLHFLRDLLLIKKEMNSISDPKTDYLYWSLIEYITSKQEFDKSGDFIIARNIDKFFRPRNDHLHKSDELTLVSQCSLNHLPRVINIMHYWDGAMSLSILVTQDNLYSAFKVIQFIMQCHDLNNERVFLHLVIPHGDISFILSKSFIPRISCVNKNNDLGFNISNYDLKKVEYPNNLLRNVGLSVCKSGFVVVIDIDMFPSYGLNNQFQDMILRKPLQKLQKFAYVVPVFESLVPGYVADKHDLLNFIKKGLVRPFYEHLCNKCQNTTNYRKWMSLESQTSLEGAYEVSWKPFWEPFYILPWNAPKYDERFRQYGFNRISHACEVHLSGYRFIVLNEAFLVHDGFKMNQKFHAQKKVDEIKNRLKYSSFLGIMKQKYSATPMTCL